MSAPAPDGAALRAEHDDLARRLAARRSIDELRKASYGGFAGLIAASLAAKLAFDRWFSLRPTRFTGPPIVFFGALAIAAVLLSLSVSWAVRARRHMRAEDALFARMRELRAQLRLDP